MATMAGNNGSAGRLQPNAGGSTSSGSRSAVHLAQSIDSGTPWPEALMEAVGLWALPEEIFGKRLYRYLISGEAFDWLLLARRIARESKGLIPNSGRDQLLHQGTLPSNLSLEDFQQLIGPIKYSAYLNYWYGVTVETAIQEAVLAEVRKERVSRGFPPHIEILATTFRRIYGEPRSVLIARYLAERERPPCPLAPGGMIKEFTYWLFKRRFHHSNSTRVASDTKKGLQWLLERHENGLSWQVTLGGLSPKSGELH
jgi:hypothetical protein